MTKLPKSWCDTEIENILEPLETGKVIQQGWSPQCERIPSQDEEWGVLKTTAIQEGFFLPKENKKLPEHLKPRSAIEVKSGDILMTCAGPRNRCGVTCFVKETRGRLMMSGKMYRFRTDQEKVNSKYLEAFLLSQEAKFEIDKMKTGISDSGLNLTHGRFKTLSVPIAPLNEQRRIVAKVEELFSELDKGVESLKTARAQLKVYRQAVLKHAFEGKLTAQWREDNKDKLETADELLERIQNEREARHQQQLEDWKSSSTQAKPAKLDRLSKSSEGDVKKYSALPNAWAYSPLGLLIDKPKYGTSKKCDYETSGHGVLRIPNVASGSIDDSDLKFAVFDDVEANIYKLEKGDILIIRSNGSISIVGKCAIISAHEEKYLYAGYLIRLRPIKGVVYPEYLLALLSSHLLRNQIEAKAKSTSGVNNINSGEIQSLAVPICSLAEQSIIVEKLSAELSSLDSLEQEILSSLEKAEALRQSILKKSFSGTLVAQDTNDEPASVLLERIKAEKNNNKKKKGKAA